MAVVPAVGRADRAPSEPAAQAASVLFERYRARIYVYCLHQLRSREEAEDATQTTFMNAFRGLERGVVPESEQAWLFKIAENVCLSRRRSSWRRGRIESPSDLELLEEVVPSPPRELADELIGLQDALEAMPENQRRAILLREWQGLSYREIAEELELSQSAVETLIFRARRTLATGLQEPEPARRRRRVLVGGLNLGSALAALKEVILGSTAAKAVAVAVAATTTTVGATNLPDRQADPRRSVEPTAVESTPTKLPAAAPAPVQREQTALKATARAAAPQPPKPERASRPAGRAKTPRPVVQAPAVVEVTAPVTVEEPAPVPVVEPAPESRPEPKAKGSEEKPHPRSLQSEIPAPAAEKAKTDKPQPSPAADKGRPEGEPSEQAGPPADKLPEQARAEGGPPEHAADGKAKGRDK